MLIAIGDSLPCVGVRLTFLFFFNVQKTWAPALGRTCEGWALPDHAVRHTQRKNRVGHQLAAGSQASAASPGAYPIGSARIAIYECVGMKTVS